MEYKPQPSIFCNDPTNLLYDEACLNIYSHNLSKQTEVYYQYRECHNCDFLPWTKLAKEGSVSLIVKSTDQLLFGLTRHSNDSCSQSFLFEQHGIYSWNVTNDGCSNVSIISLSNSDVYLPLKAFMGVVLFIIFMRILLSLLFNSQWWSRVHRGFAASQSQVQDEDGTPTSDSAPLVPSELVPAIRQLQQTRVISLDAFRGITIALMIFVNYGGGEYWMFKHSPWNGLTIADIVFPWFAFIMGVGIALSVRSKLRSGMPRLTLIRFIYRRTVILVLLGIFYSNFGNNDLTTLRIPGVLQRLGLSFFIVAFLEAIIMNRQPNFQYGRWVILQDILDSWIQWITIICIMVLHTVITLKLNVPGCPKGYLGPGGLADHNQYFNCTGGAAGFIDRQVFNDNHIYQHPSSQHIYHSKVPFDPEGLLGVLTTALTVYFGVAAGRIILCSNSTRGRIKRWVLYAVITGVEAGVLSGWSKEDGMIPINKNLWSLSFVLITASLAFCMLIFLYLIIDHWKFWSGEPFAPAGMNSILIFLGHRMVKKTFPFSYTPLEQSDHTMIFSQHVFATFLWIVVANILYKKEIFFTV